jgi:hypothetical protein
MSAVIGDARRSHRRHERGRTGEAQLIRALVAVIDNAEAPPLPATTMRRNPVRLKNLRSEGGSPHGAPAMMNLISRSLPRFVSASVWHL